MKALHMEGVFLSSAVSIEKAPSDHITGQSKPCAFAVLP